MNMIKTKPSSLLIFLSSLLLMSMTFLGCKDDGRQDIKPVNGKTIHLELTANVVTTMPVVSNSSKGFNLDVTHSAAGSMTAPINWNSDNWDEVNNKPIVLAVVRNKSSLSSVSDVRKLSDTEYQYDEGHGSFSPKIRISADFTESATDNEILFYLLDKKDFNSRFNSSDKTLSFKGGASLYDISEKDKPSFIKDIAEDIFVEPNERVFFNFVFSGAIDLSTYNGATSVSKEFDMRPVGTLLMMDFSSRESDEELNNPAYVAGFRPTLNTNAFDINTKINLVTEANVNNSSDISSQEVGFASYDESGTSTDAKTSSTEMIGGASNKLSGVYVKYVLGRPHTGFNISLSNNKVTIFKHNNSSTNFAEEYASSRVPLNMLMTSGSVKPTKPYYAGIVANNALSYVAEHNVNKAQTGFAAKNTNADAALLTWEQAKGLFTSKDFLKDYHLPSRYEWQSIIPYYASSPDYVYFNSTASARPDRRGGEECKVEIGDVVIENTISYYKTIYESGEGNVTYAIRFVSGNVKKGNKVIKTLSEGDSPYISAWRYSYVNNPNGGGKMMVVYCKVLPANTTFDKSSLTPSGVTKFDKSFFAENDGTPKTDVVYREFPTSGYGSSPSNVGSYGNFWSSSPYGSVYAYYMHFYSNYAYSNYDSASNQYAVRPFAGNK